MSSTPSSTQTDPHHDEAPTAPNWTGVEVALSKLAHGAADPRSRTEIPNASVGPQVAGPAAQVSEIPAGPRVAEPSAELTLRPADLRNDPLPSERRSAGRRAAGAVLRLLIAACIGAAGMFAWQSYGGSAWRSYGSATREMIANWVPQLGWISSRPTDPTPDPAPAAAQAAPAQPIEAAAPQAVPAQAAPAAPAATNAVAPDEPAAASPDRQQIEAMTRDLAALRQSVEQITAGQEQMAREIAKLQAEKEKKHLQRRMPAPLPRSAAIPAPRPPTLAPPQAAPQASTAAPAVPLSSQPAPQVSSQPSRPPMPVPP